MRTGARAALDCGVHPEIELYLGAIGRSLSRLVATLDDLDAPSLNWRPNAEDANSLFVIVTHMLSNAEENILGTLCGEPVERQRTLEFVAEGTSAAPLVARWDDLYARMQASLEQLPAAALEAEVRHPRRGAITGRQVLLVVARHAEEHRGEAELTRHLLDRDRGPREKG